ncbi:hypothetical protein B0T10DRAFT_92447 [Thelonectria olida]|uniref:Rhodopsin domain-containing protein n=1 Tax=Thelonectria olida TaxID=1576542 RepID=A0A9P8VZN5_9HYPO|nr:hypothetical protein B0T10DRAFT_92447 [Thelonectria olida]
MAVENRGPELQAVCYTLVVTAWISVVLRCYVRIRIVKNFGLDDWFMLAALTSFTLFISCALAGVYHGTGRHRDDLTDENFKKAMKFWWFCYLWYCISMIASKISIGYLLLRITVRRIDVLLVYGTMLITVCTGIVFFFVTLLQCRPISYFWNKDEPGSCINIEVIIALTYLYSVFSVISDFTCAILPMFLVWKLNMDRKSKIALIPIMAMACVASSAVVVRFPFVKDFRNPDFLWATIDIAIWSATEQGLAVTAGSLATLRPLLRIITHRLGLSSTGPSQLQDASHPSGSGYQGKSTPSGSRGPFSLSTFIRREENGIQIVDEESSGAYRSSQTDKSSIRKDVTDWHPRSPGLNESEEELTGSNKEQIRITTTIKQEENRI